MSIARGSGRSLVSVIAGQTNIQMGDVGPIRPVEKTECAMASDVAGLVGETALNQECLLSYCDIIVDQFLINIDAELRNAKSRCWEHDAGQSACWSAKTP